MNFLLLPDKFKGSLSNTEVLELMQSVILKQDPKASIEKLVVSDGGEGFLKTFESIPHYKRISTRTKDPLFRAIKTTFLYQENSRTAIIELAKTSGLQLLSPKEYNCMESSTYGTGLQIREALNLGAQKVILGIGGSATNDAGLGILSALGFSFYDASDHLLNPTGKNLIHIDRIEKEEDDEIPPFDLQIACDVKNPLYGEQGAAKIYASQKGANPREVEELDKGLQHFAQKIQQFNEKKVSALEGGGAAGGVGAGLYGLLSAKLVSGFSLVAELLQLKQKIKWADWVLTGEGQLDQQTLHGKWVKGVTLLAGELNTPVAGFFGTINLDKKTLKALKFTYSYSLQKDEESIESSIRQAPERLNSALQKFLEQCSTHSI